jgi:hypothetical protein
MPADRFLHPCLGASEKINALTDLEFRVWTQYVLTADDYGVMRCSAVTIQSTCDALHIRPAKTIQRCLDRLITIGLVMEFDHQSRKYIVQHDWAKYQPMKFPRATMNPAPPAEVLDRCDAATFVRFTDHHPALHDVPHSFLDDAHHANVDDAHRDAHLLTANGKRLTANGSREMFAEFWRLYPRKVGKTVAWRAWQKVNPSSELVATMLSVLAWQKQQDSWLKDGGQFIPHPSTWLNQGRWEDEPQDAPHIADSTLKTAHAVREFLKS